MEGRNVPKLELVHRWMFRILNEMDMMLITSLTAVGTPSDFNIRTNMITSVRHFLKRLYIYA